MATPTDTFSSERVDQGGLVGARGNLLVFIHILTDDERIRDPDGQECADLEAAKAEARQSARALMAEKLQAGPPA